MKLKAQNESYDNLFREFVAGQLDKKFSPRKVARGAACQEYVKYEIDLSKETFPADGDRMLIWKSRDGIYRFASLRANISGAQTISIDLTGTGEVERSQTDLLMQDIKECNHRLPIAMCFSPREACSAIASQIVQPWVDAFDAAGLVNRNSIIITKALSQQLVVPTSCKTVFEGYIQAGEIKETSAPAHITCITGQM